MTTLFRVHQRELLTRALPSRSIALGNSKSLAAALVLGRSNIVFVGVVVVDDDDCDDGDDDSNDGFTVI
ncbi:hypothetical protein ElyMa_005183300 [Elysia marginata]|uniref:Uncharacterized protein n=1 Tax=Elysia marginata TaxID=1093978 RepID=A0AAV4JXY9_9GAST|nr:hypothetical protein ElyMa_005183300 [Elysia marginata]